MPGVTSYRQTRHVPARPLLRSRPALGACARGSVLRFCRTAVRSGGPARSVDHFFRRSDRWCSADSQSMTTTESLPNPFTDDGHRLRLAVAGYLARFKGLSRTHAESDLRAYRAWCQQHHLDPLAASRPQVELYVVEAVLGDHGGSRDGLDEQFGAPGSHRADAVGTFPAPLPGAEPVGVEHLAGVDDVRPQLGRRGANVFARTAAAALPVFRTGPPADTCGLQKSFLEVDEHDGHSLRWQGKEITRTSHHRQTLSAADGVGRPWHQRTRSRGARGMRRTS